MSKNVDIGSIQLGVLLFKLPTHSLLDWTRLEFN